MENKRIPVILDVDTGSDDAIAIITAIKAPQLEVQWIASTWGNVSVKQASENTLKVLDVLNSDIPVYQGASDPLARDLHPERDVRRRYFIVHKGEKIYMHPPILENRKTSRKVKAEFAPFQYIDYLKKSDSPVTVIAVGPLTNLAIAVSLEPSIIEHIGELIIMGGGYKKNNFTPYAEANFWNDPEAVSIVLNTGIKPLIVPLDATHEAYINREECERIFNRDEANLLCKSLINHRQKVHDIAQPLAEVGGGAIHDVLAVCAAFDKNVLKDVKDVSCEICLGTRANGHMTVDRSENPANANARVAFGGNRQVFISCLESIFTE